MSVASSPRSPVAAPSALYQQVKDFVARKIADGSWKPGDRVPSEQELVAEFGMARMTVNRALRELAEQGKIVRVAGVGSFVAEEKPQSTLLQIANIADEIRQRGHDHRCELISLARVAAPLDIAASLDLRTGESVYALTCVHFEDDVAVQLEDRYVNPRMAPDFIRQDFTTALPSEYLVKHVPFDQIEHVVDAMLPTPEQAELLQMPVTQPCLMLTRRTWAGGTPVTLVRCLHPGTRYRLGSRFRADGAVPQG
jgi:GntR family transcriptional regulator, histidine utilization repressor